MVDDAIREDPENLDCQVVMPFKTDMPGMFAFEGVCPGVSGMIEIGPSPNFMDDHREDKTQEMRAFLVAPHSMHDECHHDKDDVEKQKALN
jgi:hypothetical protein